MTICNKFERFVSVFISVIMALFTMRNIMNLLKSLFIFFAPVVLIYVVVRGVMVWVDSQQIMLSFGLIFSALPLTLFLSYIMLFRSIARTGKHLLWVSIPSLFGLVLVIISGNHSQLLGLAIAAFIISLVYIYWYSDNARGENLALANGKSLPNFTVTDVDGNPVDSAKFKNKKSLLFFYRGNWCPLCMAQIDEVANHYQQLQDKGVDVIFISPQPATHTKKLAEKFNLDFQFYVDKKNAAAKKLGILHRFGLPMGFQVLGYESHSVYPTIIATDDSGNIIYSDQTDNYRVRPEPEELIKLFS